ncbi:MFS transporter [Ramlibacter tataouinensis]|uniref:MFS transporter n=1 Tax=Ramlibacter tataouinensis TaxID=94132 RepID=UPI0022F38895|nr:MFS transporter [Ramlibacter tataouinensis]WBY03957.1 MFS transporter [Ramlibacter tataouinensis]
MAASLLGIAVSVVDGSIVNLALPDITRDLGASASASVWVVTAYQLATLGLLLPFASLGERLGYRRVYLCGLGLFTIASLGCVTAVNLPMLAAARAVQGIGAAGMMAVNAALVRLIYPADRLGRGIALNSVVVATSSVAGPTIAAAVLSVASWQWLFAVNLPLCLTVLWLARRSLPHSPRHAAGPLRLADAGLNILMFSLLFLGADAVGARSGAEHAAPASVGIALLAAGIGVGVFYVRRQLDQPRPLFPVDLLRIRVFALSMCTSVTAFAAQTLAFVALPFLLLEAQGRSHLQAGLVITAWPLATVCLAPLAGRLIARYPGGLLGGVGLGLMSLGLAALATLPAQASALDMAWRLVLCGAGFGLFQSPNNHTIITSAPLARAGAASGMLGSARLTGQSTGAVMVGVIFGLVGVHDGRGPFIALAAAAVLAGVAALFSALRLRGARPL